MSGELPKYTLCVSDIKKILVDDKKIQIEFQQRLIDRSSLGTMIQRDSQTMEKTKTHTPLKKWHFICHSGSQAQQLSAELSNYLKNPSFKPSLQQYLYGYRSAKQGYRPASVMPSSFKNIQSNSNFNDKRMSQIPQSINSKKLQTKNNDKISKLPADILQKINRRFNKDDSFSIVSQKDELEGEIVKCPQKIVTPGFLDLIIDEQPEQQLNPFQLAMRMHTVDFINMKQMDQVIEKKSSKPEEKNKKIIQSQKKLNPYVNRAQNNFKQGQSFKKSQKSSQSSENNKTIKSELTEKIQQNVKIQEFVDEKQKKQPLFKKFNSAPENEKINQLESPTKLKKSKTKLARLVSFAGSASDMIEKQPEKEGQLDSLEQLSPGKEDGDSFISNNQWSEKQLSQIRSQKSGRKRSFEINVSDADNKKYMAKNSIIQEPVIMIKALNEFQKMKMMFEPQQTLIRNKSTITLSKPENILKSDVSMKNLHIVCKTEVQNLQNQNLAKKSSNSQQQGSQSSPYFNNPNQLLKNNSKQQQQSHFYEDAVIEIEIQKTDKTIENNQKNTDKLKLQPIKNDLHNQQLIENEFCDQKLIPNIQLKKERTNETSKQIQEENQKQHYSGNQFLQLIKITQLMSSDKHIEELFPKFKLQSNYEITDDKPQTNTVILVEQEVIQKVKHQQVKEQPQKVKQAQKQQRKQQLTQKNIELPSRSSMLNLSERPTQTTDQIRKNILQSTMIIAGITQNRQQIGKKVVEQSLNQDISKIDDDIVIKIQIPEIAIEIQQCQKPQQKQSLTPRFHRSTYPSQADIDGLISSWKTQIPPSISKQLNQIKQINIDKQECLDAFIQNIQKNELDSCQNQKGVCFEKQQITTERYNIRISEYKLNRKDSEYFYIFSLYRALSRKIEKSKKTASKICIAKVLYLRYKNYQGLAIEKYSNKEKKIEKLENMKLLCQQLKYFLKNLEEQIPGLTLTMLHVDVLLGNKNILHIQQSRISVMRTLMDIISFTAEKKDHTSQSVILLNSKYGPKQIIENNQQFKVFEQETRQNLNQFLASLNGKRFYSHALAQYLDNSQFSETEKSIGLKKYFVSEMLGCVYQEKKWVFEGYASFAGVTAKMIQQSYDKFNRCLNNNKISQAQSVLYWQISKIKTQKNLNHLDDYIEICIRVCQVILTEGKHEIVVCLCHKLLQSVPQFHIQKMRIYMILLNAYYQLQKESQVQSTFKNAVQDVSQIFGQKSVPLIPIYRTYALYLSRTPETAKKAQEIYLECLTFTKDDNGDIFIDLVYYYLQRQQQDMAIQYARKAYQVLKDTPQQCEAVLCLLKTKESHDYNLAMKCLCVFTERGQVEKVIDCYRILINIMGLQDDNTQLYDNEHIKEIYEQLVKAQKISNSQDLDQFIIQSLKRLPTQLRKVARITFQSRDQYKHL